MAPCACDCDSLLYWQTLFLAMSVIAWVLMWIAEPLGRGWKRTTMWLAHEAKGKRQKTKNKRKK